MLIYTTSVRAKAEIPLNLGNACFNVPVQACGSAVFGCPSDPQDAAQPAVRARKRDAMVLALLGG